ncbi:DUF6894 family protein [Devosia albogilva]|uniref:DUF6894 family protein n=1 Tax=Devosia albogilva TaxID=429726 RepID=A0ABW5QM86_9HYPH
MWAGAKLQFQLRLRSQLQHSPGKQELATNTFRWRRAANWTANMPRFFFNHRAESGDQEVDVEGMKLDSLNAALEEASFAAQAALALADEPISGEFEIEDEGRVVVARVPYTAAGSGENGPEQQ